jgi:hypothetical protein
MSHIARIELKIKDLKALKAACQEVGFQFMENQKTYEWYGSFIGDSPMPEGLTVDMLGKCDHAIKVPGASYEIGVIKTGKDCYELHCDEWDENLAGQHKKLLQPYAINATKG